VSRGKIFAISEVAPSQLDALAIPGGMGVVRTLCQSGAGPLGGGAPVPEVGTLLAALEARSAPLAVVGLARVLVSRQRGEPLDASTLAVGAREVIEDGGGTVLFTPGFMASESIADVAEGIERLVDALARKLGVVA
jgi:enhancing lycopene biosynthesis protein 2